jgi:hypothetical protein
MTNDTAIAIGIVLGPTASPETLMVEAWYMKKIPMSAITAATPYSIFTL